MAGLLDLPRELRDDIIHLVLSSPITVVPNTTRKVTNDFVFWHDLRRVFYLASTNAYRPNSLCLLLVNRQLHAETREYLARKKPPFILDLAIVDKSWLWPTWRWVPTGGAALLERVDVNLIPCCAEEERRLQVNWEERYQLGRQLHNTICSILRRFLTLGAVGDIEEQVQARLDNAEIPLDPAHFRNLRINNLFFNIDTTKYKTGNEQLSYEEIPGRAIEGMAHLTNDPLYPIDARSSEAFLALLAVELKHLLNSRWPPNPMMAKILYERIGAMHFCVNGKVQKKIHVSEYVSES